MRDTKVGLRSLIGVISFIIPAHNEQAGLGRTMEAIHDSARAVGQPYEIIVVDDASTDATAEVARQHQATVVPVNNRQIAATRNAGGRAAHGERLFFVDADTTINPRAVAAALRYMDKGAVGGGAPVLFEGKVPLPVQLFAYLAIIISKLAGSTGGAFMFCTREAFRATGGFDERLFWAEEGVFGLALKRQGRFMVLWRPVLTSPRRIRALSAGHLPAFIIRIILSPRKMLMRRASVEKIWYDSNRSRDNAISNSLGVKVGGSIGLLFFVLLATAPVWYFVPWSWTPWGSVRGDARFVIESFLCHMGLIFWPLAMVVFVNLFRRTNWLEWIRLAVIAALLFKLACDATQGVIFSWMCVWRELAHF
jgi:glycosyltransferase involved in cell wall biosynthesis